MKLSTLILTLGAILSAGSASAAPITVLNAEPAARETPAARCTTLPSSVNGPDVECVLKITQRAGDAQRPSRILIRTEVAQSRCVSRTAQVVRLSSPRVPAEQLPLVEYAGGGRACGS